MVYLNFNLVASLLHKFDLFLPNQFIYERIDTFNFGIAARKNISFNQRTYFFYLIRVSFIFYRLSISVEGLAAVGRAVSRYSRSYYN